MVGWDSFRRLGPANFRIGIKRSVAVTGNVDAYLLNKVERDEKKPGFSEKTRFLALDH
jgi:hypothetical protein